MSSSVPAAVTLRIHHIEMCVANATPVVSYFVEKLGFSLSASRHTPSSSQWVLNAGKSTFLVTEPRKEIDHSSRYPFETHCCENLSQHSVDSVFNVAFEVSDVELFTTRVVSHGGKLILPPQDVTELGGTVRYSVVSACCGNVVHTLLDKKRYHGGPFLPTFQVIASSLTEISDVNKPITTHIDHLTYICRTGESQQIIDWYSQAFGMQRFRVNRCDDPLEGMRLESPIGMRLKAMNFCAGNADEDSNSIDAVLRIVVAESLPNCPNRPLEEFLEYHSSPGIQHIALHTPAIQKTVQDMAKSGVGFRTIPNAYYRQEKKEEIRKAGEDPEAFQSLGLLVDAEGDVEVADGDEKDGFLLQIFVEPLFQKETFFLEIIQRKGAQGFGNGNVAALLKSLDEQQKLDEAQNKASLSAN